MNLVTSTRKSDAANYGFDELMDHESRYERMEEFTDVCRALWDSADPDAMLWDHATGRVGDPEKIRHAAFALQRTWPIMSLAPTWRSRGKCNTDMRSMRRW